MKDRYTKRIGAKKYINNRNYRVKKIRRLKPLREKSQNFKKVGTQK